MASTSQTEGSEELLHRGEDLSEDFTCSCCYDILLDPTTLSCGHTFCRFCLANWLYTNGKAECLQCRRYYHEVPSINFTLRNTIERILPKQAYERRKARELIPNYSDILTALEDHTGDSQPGSVRSGIGFCFCLCFLLLAVTVLYLLSMTWPTNEFVNAKVQMNRKPVNQWTTDEVSDWVSKQGSWAKGVYDERFKAAGIDGNLLLKIKEEDLIGPPINMALSLQRRVLLESLKNLLLKSNQIKSRDFWTYKASNRAKSVFLLFGLRQFPRTMMIYIFIFDYQNIFLPLLHTIHKPDVGDISTAQNVLDLDHSTWSNLQSFLLLALTFPYYLIGAFAYNYLDSNYWISRIVILHAIALTGCELTQIGWLWSEHGYRKLPGLFLQNAVIVLICGVVQRIILQFVPYFVCDLIFYWMFFISPFEAWNRLFQRLRSLCNQHQNLQDAEDGNAHFHFDFHFRSG